MLDAACKQISELVQDGVRIGRAISRSAREFAGSDLGDGHRLSLSRHTMQRIYYRWRKAKGDPSVLQLRYRGGGRPKIDPVALRLVVEHCLQTGCSVMDAVRAIAPKGSAISIETLYKSLVASRGFVALQSSDRQLSKRRKRVEQIFFRNLTEHHKRFLKLQAALHRKMLGADERLKAQMIRERERLQQNWLRQDAGAISDRRRKLRRQFPQLGLA